VFSALDATTFNQQVLRVACFPRRSSSKNLEYFVDIGTLNTSDMDSGDIVGEGQKRATEKFDYL
jgi:hypothetical protein